MLSACGLRSFPPRMPAVTVTPISQSETYDIPSGVSNSFGVHPSYFPLKAHNFIYSPPVPLPKPSAPTPVFQGPNEVLVPILLYHRIDVSEIDSQYYVSPEKFEEQMKLLRDWGYTTITTRLLVKAIAEGANLPQHPILITFDDGHLNNYTTAFPIMKKYGFTGIVYIVGGYMGTPEYMNVDQIREMAKGGWEVGSHTMRHLDLTSLDPEQQQYEIFESRRFLESEIGVPVLTFSYPFGVTNRTVINMAYSAGYIAAMGLGYTHDQGTSNLFTLQRRDINGTRDLKSFASFLPWQGDLVYLSENIPVSSSTSVSPVAIIVPQTLVEPHQEVPAHHQPIELDSIPRSEKDTTILP